MVDKTFLQEVRDRLPVSAVVGEYVSLKRAGSNYKGLCPFHGEKTPSFMVSDDKQIFHCFGCGAGGDIFTFVMKHQGLDFPDALEALATKAGLEVPKFENTIDSERKNNYKAVLEETKNFYHRYLAHDSGKLALDYLKKRKISIASIKQNFIGFAPANGRALSEHLHKKNFSIDTALELGLIRKREGRNDTYDFFRNRVMFPIFSPRGEIIAFSGRVLDEKDEPKYLNSPESSVFHKATSLFGLDKAGPFIRKNDEVIVVEGQIDVISTAIAGIQNTVAPLGTAMTSAHIHVLTRYTKNIILVFDGDMAGKKAALRMLPIFIEEGLMPKAVLLPKEEDPDSFIKKHGAEKFSELVKSASLLIEYAVDIALEENSGNDQKLKAIKQLSPIINKCADPIEKELYKKIVGNKIGIPIMETVSYHNYKPGFSKDLDINILSPERLMVEKFMRNPELFIKHFNKLDGIRLDDTWAVSMLEVLEKFKNEKDLKTKHLLDETDDDDLRREIATTLLNKDNDDNHEDIVLDCIKVILKRKIEEEISAIDNQIRQNKNKPLNEDDELKFLSLKQDLEKKRRQLMLGTKEG